MLATSINHLKIIALFKATKECVWLRNMIHHVHNTCGLNITPTLTIIYEDNFTCVAQIQTRYYKNKSHEAYHLNSFIIINYKIIKKL